MKVLGFYGLVDYLTSLFNCTNVKSMKPLVILSPVISIVSMVGFIEKWIWSPAWVLSVFLLVVCCDFVMSVSVSLFAKGGKNDGFRTDLALRFIVNIISYVMVFAIAFNLPAVTKELFGENLVDISAVLDFSARAFFFFCLLLNILSVLKHMSELNMLPKAVISFMSKYIDIHKNLIEKTVESKTKKIYGSIQEASEEDKEEGSDNLLP